MITRTDSKMALLLFTEVTRRCSFLQHSPEYSPAMLQNGTVKNRRHDAEGSRQTLFKGLEPSWRNEQCGGKAKILETWHHEGAVTRQAEAHDMSGCPAAWLSCC